MSTADGTPERIRFCLGCGEAMPFTARTCEACGHENPPVPGAPDAQVGDARPRADCPHCGEAFVASGIFCPHCGRERSPLAVPPAPEVPAEPPGARGTLRLAWVLALTGPLVLALAVLVSRLLAA